MLLIRKYMLLANCAPRLRLVTAADQFYRKTLHLIYSNLYKLSLQGSPSLRIGRE